MRVFEDETVGGGGLMVFASGGRDLSRWFIILHTCNVSRKEDALSQLKESASTSGLQAPNTSHRPQEFIWLTGVEYIKQNSGY